MTPSGWSPCARATRPTARSDLFLGDGHSPFELELTGLRDRTQTYDLGEGEFHLAFSVPDMDAAHAKHAAMGCICFENPSMGIYFIEDPDGYWIEIVPEK